MDLSAQQPLPSLTRVVAMVASSRLLHLAAAAATTTVATCFACPGQIGGAGGCTRSSTSAADAAAAAAAVTPRTASVRRRAAPGDGVGSGRESGRSSTAVCGISSTQEESLLRTRGGGAAGSGEDDPSLSETDDEVWQIINAERRRQVRARAWVAYRVS